MVTESRSRGCFRYVTGRFPACELIETMRPDGPYADLLTMLRSNPLRAWAETKRGGQSDYFTLDKEAFTTHLQLTSPSDAPQADRVAESDLRRDFAEMLHELVDWRLAEFLDRDPATATAASSLPSPPPDGSLTHQLLPNPVSTETGQIQLSCLCRSLTSVPGSPYLFRGCGRHREGFL